MTYKNRVIADKIKKFRKAKKLTQKDMAEFLRINKQVYHFMENNKRRIYAEDLFQIAGILGINIYDFGTLNIKE
jgi:transcriptional regulator with XRE-family HTH domain